MQQHTRAPAQIEGSDYRATDTIEKRVTIGCYGDRMRVCSCVPENMGICFAMHTQFK
jgi:hypothetical protein